MTTKVDGNFRNVHTFSKYFAENTALSLNEGMQIAAMREGGNLHSKTCVSV